MPRTKKPAQAAADLPIAATETPVVKKARPSRSKAAVAMREKVKAVEAGDYSSLTEADVRAMRMAARKGLISEEAALAAQAAYLGYKAADATGAYAGMTGDQDEREIAEIDANLAELDKDVRNELLDDEIEKAVAALEAPVDDVEVVRSLADVDVGGSDPFALIDAIPHEFGTLITTPAPEEAAWARLKHLWQRDGYDDAGADSIHARINELGELQLVPCTIDTLPSVAVTGDYLVKMERIVDIPTAKFGYQVSKEGAEQLHSFLDQHFYPHRVASVEFDTNGEISTLNLKDGRSVQFLTPPQAVIDVLREIRAVLGFAEWASPEGAEQILHELIDKHCGPASDALAAADRQSVSADGVAIQEAINAAVHDLQGS